ncbi:hypothetical protein FRC03_002357 [Tulasnella sp. 419]|nr:hypothetical protein FRC03_002357 [Tulasnella sp. 419]
MASYGHRQRSQSFVPNNDSATPRHPSSSVHSHTTGRSNTTLSRTSSRRSSLHSRRASMLSAANSSTREPNLIRRGSSTVWSELQGPTMDFPEDMDPDEKRKEQITRLQSTFNGLWHDGAGKLVIDLAEALAKAWFAGEITALRDASNLNLGKSDYAHVIVETEALIEQVTILVRIFVTSPELSDLIVCPNSCTLSALEEVVLDSSENISTLLQILSCVSKIYLKVQPHLSPSIPSQLIPAIRSFASLCAFLIGSPVPFAHVFHSLIEFSSKTSPHTVNFAKEIVAITSSTPSSKLFGSYSFANHPNGYVYSPQHVGYQLDHIEEAWSKMMSQSIFKTAYESLANNARVLWNSILGNSRVLRARRSASRVWNSELNETLGEKVEAVLQGVSTAEALTLDDISSDNEEFSYSFTNLKLRLVDLIPTSISLDHSTKFGSETDQNHRTLTLSGVTISIPEAKYDLAKHGAVGFTDSGVAGISISSTVHVTFDPISVKVDLENVDIHLTSNVKSGGGLRKVWDMWLSYVVKAKLKEVLDGRIESTVEEWLKPLVSDNEEFEPFITITEPDRTGTATPGTVIPSAPRTPVMYSIPPPSPLPRTATNPISARAAFLRSVQMSASATPGGTVPPIALLKTGRDLLSTLENPFSGPNSAIGADDEHEEDGHSNMPPKKGRAMSMAASLSEVASLDSTTLEHIQRPPRDRTVSHTEWNISLAQRKPILPNVRRLSLAYTPIGEPSLEDYSNSTTTYLDTHTLAEEEAENRYYNPLMADSLDEKATRDMSTPEGLEAAYRDGSSRTGFAKGSNGVQKYGKERRLSMLDVTKELNGGVLMAGEDITQFMDQPSLSSRHSRRRSKEEYAGLSGRRKSMSEYLTEGATVDNTDLSKARPGSPALRRQPSGPATHSEPPPSMSSMLNQVSSVDTTLPERIATPPITQTSRRSSSRKSFTQLNDAPSMAEVGIDETITRDDTISGSNPTSRRPSEGGYHGLETDEIKMNSMAAWVEKIAFGDGTLPETAANPLTVDQNFEQVVGLPHPLSSRKSSMAAAKAEA